VKKDDSVVMIIHKPSSPRLQSILKEASALSHDELLHLIAYLAEQAQYKTVRESAPTYQWTDIEGIVEDSLTGMDAQEWVNQVRAQDWERDDH
jgi:hypothetical protein